jgi:hypothetical protein
MTPSEPLKRTLALANWQRVRSFWLWTGRTDDDKRILKLLSRYAPEAPINALRRAQLGHPHGGGQMRPGGARALVGAVLGIRYIGPHHHAARVEEFSGLTPSDLRAYLRALREFEHLDLAEHWLDYLRRERDDRPAAWELRSTTERENATFCRVRGACSCTGELSFGSPV